MRILIINPFGIGDVLFSTPLVSNLKINYPQAFLVYICNKRTKDVLCNNPHIDKIFVFEKDEYRNLWKKSRLKCIKEFMGFLWHIKKQRFDLAIDLSLGRHYSFFLWLIGVKKRIGYNYRNRGRFLTHKFNLVGYDEKPIADYYLELLKFLHIRPRPFELTMNIPPDDREWANNFFKDKNLNGSDLVIGIIPAGGASWGKDFSYRHWPWENYAQVADKLITELKAKVIILGDASEQGICQRMQSAVKKNLINACGKTSLKQFAGLLAKCNLVICNDGGPLHVAVSQNTKTVSIFGPVDEKVYGPYPSGSRHIIVTKNIDCRPCYKRFKLPICLRNRQCIKDISADEVLEIIKSKLRR